MRLASTIAIAAMLAAAPAAAETANADFLGSIFAGTGIGAVVASGVAVDEDRVNDALVAEDLRAALAAEIHLPDGFFRSSDFIQDARFVGTLDTRADRRLEFFRLEDNGVFLRRFEAPIRTGGVERLNRARGYIASEIRKRERAR